MSSLVLRADARHLPLADESVQLVVTSPPYFALRDYGVDGQIGLEKTPAAFLASLLAVFDEVKRVLRPDGTCWVNIGDSYSGSGKGPGSKNGITKQHSAVGSLITVKGVDDGVPPKNLLLMPERFAIAMQDRGWIVRSRIAWCKTSAMPESVRDRPTSAWEHIWMFSKSRTYYYDAEAVRQPNTDNTIARHSGPQERPNNAAYSLGIHGHARRHEGTLNVNGGGSAGGANLRNYWLLGPEPLREQHYAAFPSEIPKRCILAGTSEKGACPACGAPWVRVVERGPKAPEPSHRNPTKRLEPGQAGNADAGNMGFRASRLSGQEMAAWRALHPDQTTGWQQGCACPPAEPVPQIVLDPFLGSGTTALVADRLGRHGIGVELNPEYAAMARRRLREDAPMLDVVQQAEQYATLALFDSMEADLIARNGRPA